jgi:NDP-sugar pyrophosphorylase family protein
MIPALVLTAGLATRLRPLSLVRAKAAFPVAGKPLIQRILEQLAAAGVTDAVLNLHHLPHTLTAVVGDGSDVGVRVRYSWEMPVLGSAGGPRHALPLIDGSTFLLVNGDTLTDVDLASVVSAHRETGALVTMAVVPNSEPEKYGGALVDPDGAITGFTRRGSGERSYHVIGVQVAEADAFAGLPDGVPAESVSGLYRTLIQARPGAIRVHVSAAEFLDIGTPDDYLQTSRLLAGREGSDRLTSKNARIDDTARVEASILWDDVDVGAGAVVRQCIVTDGVRIPAGTSWSGVAIRTSNGELTPGERLVDGLAVASLHG